MTIEWRADDRQFHLANGQLSLVLRVYGDGSLGQLHLGAPLPTGRSYRHLGPHPFEGYSNRVGDPIPFVLPTSGIGDFRVPALVAAGSDGVSSVALTYVGHAITPGKPSIEPLPATYVETDDEAETLTVTLRDERTGLEADVRLTLFTARPAIARSQTFRATRDAMTIETAMSASLDLPDADWTMVQLSGAWARETEVLEHRLRKGRASIASQRGASGAEHNPFLALRRPMTDESSGEVLALSLVYSGNFLAEAEVDPFGTTRTRIGIEPETFAWRLEPGEAFTTPEAVIVRTDGGLGAMSHAFHDLYRARLARGVWRDRPRPIVLNNWEATYFDFDADRLVAIAAAARDLGVELFVLDDGWFGRRDADDSSLGDWVVDRRKLPDGLDALGRRIVDLGLDFGLWIEPEMVSPDSHLYRAHPDWAISIPGRPPTESRQQLVLDMGRPEVVDHLATVLGDILASAPISYVKWDMNRNLTDPAWGALPPERQGEGFHRHILGTYELYRRLTTRFPAILFESCASGGGRFDPGMLAFAPQAWTSDDTDAVERLAIQWGTSYAYPLSAMAAHVSAVPNHQVGRVTPIETRAAVAFFGVFGYELDPTRLTAEEQAAVREQIAWYAARRATFQRGRFHRLAGPLTGDPWHVAWMVVAEDGAEAIVGVYGRLNRPTPEAHRVRLRGLEADAEYRVSTWPDRGDDPVTRPNLGLRSGAELQAAGLMLDRERHDAARLGDFWSRLFVLERVYALGAGRGRGRGPERGPGPTRKGRPRRSGRRTPRSALGGPEGEPANELLLQYEEDDERGDGDHDRPRRHQVVVGKELALQVVQGGRDRVLVAGPHEDEGPEEVVVHPGDLEDGQGGQRRPRQRHRDLPEDPPHRRPVDEGRLVQLDRQRPHVVAQHERTEPELERDVDHHHAEVLVVEQAVVAEERRQGQRQVHPVERRDDDLRREQVGGREQQQQRDVEAPAEARGGERHHRRQEQHDDRRRRDDDQRVEEVLRDLGAGPGVLVVLEAEVPGEGHVAVDGGVLVRPERGVDGPQQREQPDQ
jgi:alpha-galactosidase